MPFLGLVILCTNVSFAQTKHWTSARPDGHAPINFMSDHYHKKGEVMFSYRYMPMWMKGNIQSTKDIADGEIYNNYMVSPQKMQMNMHMLGIMYAPSDRLTLMLMGNYTSKSMQLKTKTDVTFTTKSSGFGDMMLTGLVKLVNKNRQSFHGIIGLSIPTGNIKQSDATPMMSNARLAYPMQLGSGTWDPVVGLTYLGQSDKISWGAQSSYKFRTGSNPENYRLGNKYEILGWGAVKASNYMSLFASFSYSNTQKIKGSDAELNPMMMPLFNTANSGRSQMDLGFGVNFYVPKGDLKNIRLAAAVTLPVYQKVNGIQMKNQLAATVGIQYSMGH